MATEGKDEVERTATEPEVEQPEGENGNDPYADMTMRKAVLGIIGGLSKIALKLILILALAGGAIYGVLYGVGYLGARVIESAAPGGSSEGTDDVQAFRDALAEEFHQPNEFRPPAPLPEGMERVEFAPPKIDVPEGQPQPIETKWGWTYSIPADWRNGYRSSIWWQTAHYGPVAYGAAGTLRPATCDNQTVAFSGVAGRNGMSIDDAARAEIRVAEHAYLEAGKPAPSVEYSEPQHITIDGHDAVRISARVSNITKSDDCDPSAATIDIVALPGYSHAEVALFIVNTEQGVPGEIDPKIADTIFSTIRQTSDN